MGFFLAPFAGGASWRRCSRVAGARHGGRRSCSSSSRRPAARVVRPIARAPPAHAAADCGPAPPRWSGRPRWSLERIANDEGVGVREDRRRGLDRAGLRRGRGHRGRRARPGHRDPGRHGARERVEGDRSGRRLIVAVVLVAVRAVRRGADGPDHPAGAGRRRRAPRPLQPHARARADDRRAVHRPRQAADRPARAGRHVPAAAGDHRGQPRRPDRHRPLLHDHRPARPSPTRSPTRCRRSSSSRSPRCATSSAA